MRPYKKGDANGMPIIYSQNPAPTMPGRQRQSRSDPDASQAGPSIKATHTVSPVSPNASSRRSGAGSSRSGNRPGRSSTRSQASSTRSLRSAVETSDSKFKAVIKESKRTAREEERYRSMIEKVKAVSLSGEGRKKPLMRVVQGIARVARRASGSTRSRNSIMEAEAATQLGDEERVMIAEALSREEHEKEKQRKDDQQEEENESSKGKDKGKGEDKGKGRAAGWGLGLIPRTDYSK